MSEQRETFVFPQGMEIDPTPITRADAEEYFEIVEGAEEAFFHLGGC